MGRRKKNRHGDTSNSQTIELTETSDDAELRSMQAQFAAVEEALEKGVAAAGVPANFSDQPSEYELSDSADRSRDDLIIGFELESAESPNDLQLDTEAIYREILSGDDFTTASSPPSREPLIVEVPTAITRIDAQLRAEEVEAVEAVEAVAPKKKTVEELFDEAFNFEVSSTREEVDRLWVQLQPITEAAPQLVDPNVATEVADDEGVAMTGGQPGKYTHEMSEQLALKSEPVLIESTPPQEHWAVKEVDRLNAIVIDYADRLTSAQSELTALNGKVANLEMKILEKDTKILDDRFSLANEKGLRESAENKLAKFVGAFDEMKLWQVIPKKKPGQAEMTRILILARTAKEALDKADEKAGMRPEDIANISEAGSKVYY